MNTISDDDTKGPEVKFPPPLITLGVILTAYGLHTLGALQSYAVANRCDVRLCPGVDFCAGFYHRRQVIFQGKNAYRALEADLNHYSKRHLFLLAQPHLPGILCCDYRHRPGRE